MDKNHMTKRWTEFSNSFVAPLEQDDLGNALIFHAFMSGATAALIGVVEIEDDVGAGKDSEKAMLDMVRSMYDEIEAAMEKLNAFYAETGLRQGTKEAQTNHQQ